MLTIRYAAIYGILAGAVIAAIISTLLALFGKEGPFATLWFGYLVQLVGLSFVFVGVKRYRDVERGGVVGFWRALGVGLAIVVAAALAYSLVWEIYLWLTNYTFMDEFIAQQRASLEAKHLPAAEISAQMAEIEGMRTLYANPLFRIPFTMAEMFIPVPVGLIVPLVSAALLRNPKILPAR
jgi:hypothetical protein